MHTLDMFYMIENPGELLRELARIVKSDGKVWIEDGHQPRKETLGKINKAGITRNRKKMENIPEKQKKYDKLMEVSFVLSRVNRKLADQKYADAEAVMEKIVTQQQKAE